MDKSEFQLLNKHFDAMLAAADPVGYLANIDIAEDLKNKVRELYDCHCQQGGFLSELPFLSRFVEHLQQEFLELAAGAVIDDFILEEKIGRGGFGQVYRARQRSLERQVAIKLTPDTGNEARTMAQLEHEAIVPIYQEKVLPEKKLRMICMPYIAGADFDAILQKLDTFKTNERSGALLIAALDALCPVAENFDPAGLSFRNELMQLDYPSACVKILLPIVDALSFAHSRDILHLDVKPGNVLIDRYGRSKLADFNIAVAGHGKINILGGTDGFMSPEQRQAFAQQDVDIDARSDIYSFGKLLEYVLQKGLGAHALPSLNQGLRQIIADCTEPNPARRIPGAVELKEALCGFLRESQKEQNLQLRRKRWFGSERGSLLFYALAILCPQVIGSLINIAYNHEQIITNLSPAQSEAFFMVLGPYNIIFYPLCLYLALRKVWRIYRARDGEELKSWRGAKQAARLVTEWLGFGRVVIIVSSLGWLPGAFIFPFAIEQLAGELPWQIYVHFFLSFVTSWLIASTYSYYLVQMHVFGQVLPENLSPYFATGRLESFQKVARWVKYGVYPAGAVPLSAALMILFVDPEQHSIELRVLLASLITIGILGFTIVHRIIIYLEDRIRIIAAS